LLALFNPTNPSNKVLLNRVRAQAESLGIKVPDFAVSTPEELNTAFVSIAVQRPQALLVIPDAGWTWVRVSRLWPSKIAFRSSPPIRIVPASAVWSVRHFPAGCLPSLGVLREEGS